MLEGKAYLAQRNGDESHSIFKDVIARYQQKQGFEVLVSQAFFGLGESLEIKDNLSEAVSAYKQALVAYPNKNDSELNIKRVEKRRKERNLK